MQMVLVSPNSKNKYLLPSLLPPVFFLREVTEQVKRLQETYAFSNTTRTRLLNSAAKLEVKWQKPSEIGSLYSFLNRSEINQMDILAALCRNKNSYLSHYSALYLNDLILQRPYDHFVSIEKPGKSRGKITKLNDHAVRQAFLKPSKQTQHVFSFDESKFHFIDKMSFNQAGVVSKEFMIGERKIALRVTSVERTFIDSIISPHYAGGITTVVAAYANRNMNLEELLQIYSVIDPIYPYWQTIGFLLEKLCGANVARKWREPFANEEQRPFFLEHEAKSYWKHSDTWNISYPGGVFGEA